MTFLKSDVQGFEKHVLGVRKSAVNDRGVGMYSNCRFYFLDEGASLYSRGTRSCVFLGFGANAIAEVRRFALVFLAAPTAAGGSGIFDWLRILAVVAWSA